MWKETLNNNNMKKSPVSSHIMLSSCLSDINKKILCILMKIYGEVFY